MQDDVDGETCTIGGITHPKPSRRKETAPDDDTDEQTTTRSVDSHTVGDAGDLTG